MHIQNQNRRFHKLIIGALSPLLAALVLISPLLTLGIMECCASPSEPMTVTYADCRWEYGGRNTSLVLYTAGDKQWMLSNHLRTGFYQDVQDGKIVPGDSLTITWYPWILRSAVATLSSSDRIYGDMTGWQAQQRRDAGTLFTLSAILFGVGLAVCGLILWCERNKLAEIRKLKRKYRTRIAEADSAELP